MGNKRHSDSDVADLFWTTARFTCNGHAAFLETRGDKWLK